MIDISATGRDFQDEFLNLIAASQETMMDALQAWSSAVQAATPSVFKVDVPYAAWLPKPETLVSGAYDFAEQVLATQRKFASEVFLATVPLTGAAG